MPGESLRDQLQETWDALSADDQAGAEAPAVAAPANDVAETPPAAETPPVAAGEPVRDEHGRFAPKTPAPAAEAPAGDPQAVAAAPPVSETAKPEDKEAPSEPIRVPPSLPAAIKAKFATLEPDVREAFTKLEESVQTAKAEWGKKGERLNRYDELFSPRREQLAMRGLDEVQAVQMLFAAQDLLDRNPTQGIVELARSYGVNLVHLGQQMSGGQPTGQGAEQPGQPPGFDQNALQPLFAQALAPLQQQLAQLTQQTEAEKTAAAHQTVTEFASRPENIYWEDVKSDVARLLQNDLATSLQDAYEQAIWRSPTIRPLLIEAQTSGQQREAKAKEDAQKRQDADRARSQAAAQAAGSVTGAPQGAQATPPGTSTGNLRQDLEATWSQLQAQV